MLLPLLHEIRRTAHVEVAMAAVVSPDDSDLSIDHLIGVTSDTMRNLKVHRGAGLGGKALSLGQPVHVRDYCLARGITHQYDVAVRTERLRAMFAVPFDVPGGPRGVVYGALRRAELFGDRSLDPVIAAIRRFERTAALERDARTSLSALDAELDACVPNEGLDERAHAIRLLDIRAELDHIAALLPAGEARDAVRALVYRVAARATTPGGPPDAAALTKREREFVAQVALGHTNREIAKRLNVGQETVKSGLRSSMRKLSARNRAELVALARTAGEL